jgi:hypothetical protein
MLCSQDEDKYLRMKNNHDKDDRIETKKWNKGRGRGPWALKRTKSHSCLQRAFL